MKRFLLVITEELSDAVDIVRGSTAKNPWIENELRKVKKIRDAAGQAGIEFPERPMRDYVYEE
jgi:hypothetical protein